jgi:dTDP-4-dehydrorhamnose reductase
MKTIWVLGKNGLLGSHLMNSLPQHSTIGTSKKEVDITNINGLSTFVEKHKELKYVINAAASTDTTKAEVSPRTSFRVNALGPENLVKVLNYMPSRPTLIHFSSDYVYSIPHTVLSPHTVFNFPGQLSAYGYHKASGDKAIFKNAQIPYYIFRVAHLFTPLKQQSTHQDLVSALLLKILSGKTVYLEDRSNNISMTYIPLLVGLIKRLVKDTNSSTKSLPKCKTYNFACTNYVSMDELVQLIAKLFDKRVHIQPMPKNIKNIKNTVRRPHSVTLLPETHEAFLPYQCTIKEALTTYKNH